MPEDWFGVSIGMKTQFEKPGFSSSTKKKMTKINVKRKPGEVK